MRSAFIDEIIKAARRNPDVFLLVGDLGYSVVERFEQEFPERFLNAGVAEQNMAGIAAGLAAEGYRPFIYSIGNFSTLRCVEQIRNDICYHKLPVTVVAVGGGLAYGNMGYSHHAIQDLAIMRTLPGINVIAPGDPNEARMAIRWLLKSRGPNYLRLGKSGEANFTPERGYFQTLRCVTDRKGKMAICSTGSILDQVEAAGELLEQSGVLASTYSVPLVKPEPSDIARMLSQYSIIITVEEHVYEGGFGAMMASKIPNTTRFGSLAVSEEVAHQVGTQQYLRAQAGIDAQSIALYCLKMAKSPRRSGTQLARISLYEAHQDAGRAKV